VGETSTAKKEAKKPSAKGPEKRLKRKRRATIIAEIVPPKGENNRKRRIKNPLAKETIKNSNKKAPGSSPKNRNRGEQELERKRSGLYKKKPKTGRNGGGDPDGKLPCLEGVKRAHTLGGKWRKGRGGEFGRREQEKKHGQAFQEKGGCLDRDKLREKEN